MTRLRTTRSQPRRGFTLIDSIAAVLILAIAIPPMVLAVRAARIDQVNPVLVSRARWLAVEKLEEIVADRFSLTRGYTWLDTSNYPSESPVSGFAGYTRSVTFTETEVDLVTAGTGYMNVTVTVGWTDARDVARQITISTVVTEYGS